MSRKRNRIRAVAAALAILTGGTVGTLSYITRPAALEQRLSVLFRRIGFHVVSVGDISFSFWSGLSVTNLEIDPARGIQMEPYEAQSMVRIPRVTVACDRGQLLVGRFVAREIVLQRPEITLMRPGKGQSLGWRIPEQPSADGSGWSPGDFPAIRIEGGDLRLLTADSGPLRLLRRWIVDGEGRLFGGDQLAPLEYRLLLRQTRGTGSSVAAGNAKIELTWRPGELRAAAGPLDFETLGSLVPAQFAELAERVGLSGDVWLNEFVHAATGGQSADVGFSGLRFTVPAGEGLNLNPAEKDLLTVSGAAGRMQLTSANGRLFHSLDGFRADLHVQLDGRLADAEFSLTARARDAAFAAANDADAGNRGPGTHLTSSGRDLRLRLRDADLPTREKHAGLLDSDALPSSLRAFFNDYRPNGRIDLDLDFAGGSVADDPNPPTWFPEPDTMPADGLRGELRPKRAACTYFRFPYKISDVTGTVRFGDKGIDLVDLLGHHGGAAICTNGHVNHSGDTTGFSIECRGVRIGLGGDLYAALPENYQRLWRSADPAGVADAVVRVSRDEPAGPEPCPTRVAVNAELISGAISLSPDRRLTQVNGRIHIEDGRLDIDELQGFLGDAAIRVTGSVSPASHEGQPPIQDLQFEASSMPLARSGTLHDAQGAALGEVSFTGTGDVWGVIRSDASGTEESYTVRVTDGEMNGFHAADPFRDLHGWIQVRGDEHRIERLSARRGDEWFDLSGNLPADAGTGGPAEFELSAGDPAIERLLRRLIPARWNSVREGLGLSGGGTVHAVFRSDAAVPHQTTGETPVPQNASATQAVDIRVSAERMKPGILPLDLSAVTAYLTLRQSGMELHKADASYGAGSAVSVQGRAGWDATDEWVDLNGTGRSISITPAFMDAMPAPLARLLRRIALSGKLDFQFDTLRMASRNRGEWDFGGVLNFDAASLRIGAPLTDFSGELRGTCRILPGDQTEIAATFRIDHGVLSQRPIREWEGRLVQTAGRRGMRLEDVHGYLCGGQMVGEASIDPESGEYEVSMTLDDVSLEEFLRDGTSRAGPPREGRIHGRVFLRGKGDDPAARVGGGELRITGTSLMSSPVTAGLAQAGSQKRSALSAHVERADIRFVWEGDEMRFNRVDIQSRDQRLVGRGVWNTRRDTVSLELLSASPEDAARLPVISELLERASNELMQYRIEGPADNPRVTLEPLHNLTEPLRKLLRGE